jgi:hypothetical protein
MKTIRKYMSQLELGDTKVFENLKMFSISAPSEGSLEYMTLNEALALGVARVSEKSWGGSVPELRFKNSGDLPVLILDGEELVGAKQNRTVNLTVLAPAKKTITIPVSCVEAGRWQDQSTHFEMADHHHFALGRAAKMASVSHSLRCAGSRVSDQQRVWADISAKAERMDACSATGAMDEIFDRHRGRVEDYVAAFRSVATQTGALFAIGSKIAGLDLFDRKSTLAAMLPKLVRSYAIDAMERSRGEAEPATGDDAKSFLDKVAETEIETYGAVGLGNDLRLRGEGLVGGGLAVDGELIHLAAFALTDQGEDERGGMGRMLRMSARRSSFHRA